MLLAGVVMKLGAYGCLRVAMTLFPHGLDPWGFTLLGFGSWRDVLSLLAVIGIVYGAMVALVQKDFKFVIGYSSVSHMGFVLLGLMTLNAVGLSGAVLQMFSHGIIAGLLFAVVGRMVYDRTHTRELAELQRMNLSTAAAVCGGDLHHRQRGLDGPAGVQRLRGGAAGADRRVAGVSDVGRRGGAGRRDGRGLRAARPATGVFPGERANLRPSAPRQPEIRLAPWSRFRSRNESARCS